jgi:hypothetical protein
MLEVFFSCTAIRAAILSNHPVLKRRVILFLKNGHAFLPLQTKLQAILALSDANPQN